MGSTLLKYNIDVHLDVKILYRNPLSQPSVGKDVQIYRAEQLYNMPFTENDNNAYLYFVA